MLEMVGCGWDVIAQGDCTAQRNLKAGQGEKLETTTRVGLQQASVGSIYGNALREMR
jgi:hypothetical protein